MSVRSSVASLFVFPIPAQHSTVLYFVFCLGFTFHSFRASCPDARLLQGTRRREIERKYCTIPRSTLLMPWHEIIATHTNVCALLSVLHRYPPPKPHRTVVPMSNLLANRSCQANLFPSRGLGQVLAITAPVQATLWRKDPKRWTISAWRYVARLGKIDLINSPVGKKDRK